MHPKHPNSFPLCSIWVRLGSCSRISNNLESNEKAAFRGRKHIGACPSGRVLSHGVTKPQGFSGKAAQANPKPLSELTCIPASLERRVLAQTTVRCSHFRMQRTEGSHLPGNESPSSFGNPGSACGSSAWFFWLLLTRLQSPLPALLVSQLSSVCTVLALPSDPQLLIPQGRAQTSPLPPPTVPVLLAGLVSQIP